MPRTPNSQPAGSTPCDMRLPMEALDFRRRNRGFTTEKYLGAINITAWLYADADGVKRVLVNPNTTIAELIKEFGPAQTPDAEVGFHSEGRAAEYFRTKPNLRVLQIFSERIPCPMMCAPLLRHYYPGVPWYYYYDRRSWRAEAGAGLLKTAAGVLKTAYGL